jgi:hypothetical protein
MNNAIMKQETSVPAVQSHHENIQEVISSDVLIPRLLLMQGISPLVTGRKAQIGDMIRSTTGEKLGNPESPVPIIPLKMVNTWILMEDTGEGQPKFRGTEERTHLNEHLPWEFQTQDGKQMTRVKAISLYALLPGDVHASEAEMKKAIEAGEAPDLSKTVMPVLISFQKTSYKYAGKKCASFFNNVKINSTKVPGLRPYQYVLTLSCREEKKEKNLWYVFDMDLGKPIKDNAIKSEAARWAMMLNSGNIKIDDSQELDVEHSTGNMYTEKDI